MTKVFICPLCVTKSHVSAVEGDDAQWFDWICKNHKMHLPNGGVLPNFGKLNNDRFFLFKSEDSKDEDFMQAGLVRMVGDGDSHLTNEQAVEIKGMGPLGEDAAHMLQRLRADHDGRHSLWQEWELRAALVYWTLKMNRLEWLAETKISNADRDLILSRCQLIKEDVDAIVKALQDLRQ